MYYYNDGEKDVGPFSIERLRSLRRSGLIGPDTLIRENSADEWRPLAEIDRVSDKPLITGEPDSLIDPIEERAHEDARSADELDLAQVSGWLLKPETPWRRYAARILDTSVNGALGLILFGVTFYAIAPHSADSFFSLFESGAGRVADLVLTAIFASFVGGMLIGSTGLTLGKVIFGVKVTRLDGAKLGLKAGLARDFDVLVRGLGLAIPIVSLFTMVMSFNRLRNEGATAWDQGKYLVSHRPSGPAQYVLNIIGVALIVVVVMGLRALSEY